MNRGTLLAALALSLWIVGCGDEDDAPLCTPGASVACVGTSGCAGAQVCNAEGTGFGACSCGPGPDGGPSDSGTDGGTDDGGTDDSGTNEDAAVAACNVLEQTGCMNGEDCSWVSDELLGERAECVTAGTIPLHGECITLEDGTPDQCAAGLTCLAGNCERVCAMADGCTGAAVCQLWVGFVDDGSTGICTPTCDPVSQTRLDDGAAACGSPAPAFPTLGCYGYLGGPFTCSRFPNSVMTLTHGATALTSPSGAPYVIGCAPGYVSLGTAAQGVFRCHALCTPAETFMGNDAQRQGAAPHTCAARGATAATEECRFSGFYLDDPSEGLPAVGVCVDPTDFTWDHDMDLDAMTPEVPWPSCSTLTSGDTDGNEIPDHVYWGCGPRTAP